MDGWMDGWIDIRGLIAAILFHVLGAADPFRLPDVITFQSNRSL